MRTNWQIKSRDPKEQLQSHFVRKSQLLDQLAKQDKERKGLFDLSYKKDMTNQQRANFALGFLKNSSANGSATKE